MRYRNRKGIASHALQFMHITGAALLTVCLGTTTASAKGGPGGGGGGGSDDPSGLTPLVIDADGSELEGLPEANGGTFEGGNTGHVEDASENNVLQPADQRPRLVDDPAKGTVFNIPSNGPPSPLFGATEFSQQMLRFEEFGTRPLDLNASKPNNWFPLPAPADAQSAPDGAVLEDFLDKDIWPTPTVFANTQDLNPWQSEIEDYLGRALDDPPMEGRPPGLGWSHQRWDDFTPTTWFQTAQAGARTNGGFRDERQSHDYGVRAVCITTPPVIRAPKAPRRVSRSGSTRTCRCRTTSHCGRLTAPCRRNSFPFVTAKPC
jgi:hypothetical protein